MLDELAREVYRATQHFPSLEREGLGRTLRRTAVSAAVRLAADDGPGGAEQASVHLAELRYYLYLARRLRLLDAVSYRSATARHDRAARVLERLRTPAGEQVPARRARRGQRPVSGDDHVIP
jgi:four helix bundle protein